MEVRIHILVEKLALSQLKFPKKQKSDLLAFSCRFGCYLGLVRKYR